MAGETRLRAELERRGGWPGPVEHRPRVGSTNAELRRAAREVAPFWSVLTASTQTAGRGRHGRSWHSPEGHLYLSVLLPPPTRPERAGLVPLLGGLALAEALAGAGVATRLKWPNDVLDSDGRKLAGILAEATSGEAGVESIVIGFGVNLVEDPALPAELRAAVGVARDAQGRAPDRDALAAALLVGLCALLAELDAGAVDALLARWRERAVDWWGREVEVGSGAERLRGIARDLDAAGALVIELEGGERRAVTSGEARELRPAPR